MSRRTGTSERTTRAVFAGRIDVLYTLGRHYLSLPFAVLCIPVTLFGDRARRLSAIDAAAVCRSRS